MRTTSYQNQAAPYHPYMDTAPIPTTEWKRRTPLNTAQQAHELANELNLAARVEAALREIYPCEVVNVEDSVATVDVEAPLLWEPRLVEEFNAIGASIPGLRGLRIHLLPAGIHGLG